MSKAGRSPIALGLALALGVGTQGCDDQPGPASESVVHDTIDGVEHVTTRGPGVWAGRASGWRLGDSTRIVVGEAEGPVEYVFGQISAVAVDSQGQIFVADPQAKEIRLFSEAGVYQRRFGRDGEGPGEFRHISGLAVAPDGIGALDGQLGRVTVFDSSGTVLRSFRLARSYMVLESHAVMAFDSAGRFFDRARLARRPDIDSIGVITYTATGVVSDTVVLATVVQDQLTIERDGRPYMSVPRPYAPRPSLTFGPDGTTYFARGGEYRVDVYSADGDLVRVIQRPVQRLPVSDAERDSAIAFIERTFEEGGGEVPGSVDLPELKPAIVGLEVDSEGNLWVLNAQPSGDTVFQWSVHDPEGRYLGDVATPAMAVDQIGRDFLAGTIRDSLDVSRAVVFPLVKEPVQAGNE